MAGTAKQRYLDARVEDRLDFVGGVQFALDQMLSKMDQLGVGGNLEYEYSFAYEILEAAKKGTLNNGS